MSGVLAFLLSIVVLGATAVWLTVGAPETWKKYFSTQKGRKIKNGIIIFVGLGTLVALLSIPGKAGAEGIRWVDYGEIYLGLDYTARNPSPQCRNEGADTRMTSNGGARVNLLVWPDDSFHANLKYTHHSCAVSPDRNTYDAVGLELVYRLW